MARLLDFPLVEARQRLQFMLRLIDNLVTAALITLADPLCGIGTEAEQRDVDVNRLERELQERIVSAFVRFQPVASDHRLLMAMMEIIHHLSHMGDSAKRICALGGEIVQPADALQRLAHVTRRKTGECFRVLHQLELTDIGLATSIATSQPENEAMFERVLVELVGMGARLTIRELEVQLLVASELKRIADHAAGIAGQLLFYNFGAHP